MFLAIFARSQSGQDWFWTFQWGGAQYGLLYENANLLPVVKAAIRDDIRAVYSRIPISDAAYSTYQPGQQSHGQFTGKMFFHGTHACPQELGGWDYITHVGSKYFFVDSDVCAKYVGKVALTNQHAAAIGTLSNFLASAQSMTTNNTTTAMFLQKFWHLNHDRIPVQTDDHEVDFLTCIQEWGAARYVYPSLLQFANGKIGGMTCFHAKIYSIQNDPELQTDVYVVFKGDQWRFLVWDW